MAAFELKLLGANNASLAHTASSVRQSLTTNLELSHISGGRVIAYVGGFGLPSSTAAAIRAIENAKLFQSLGYEPVIIGKFRSRHDAAPGILDGLAEAEVRGVTCVNIERPDDGPPPASYVHSAEPIRRIVERLGTDRLHSIIAYNYPARGLAAAIAYGNEIGVPVIAECTDWHGVEGRSLLRNIVRLLGAELRMRWLARRAGHIICATEHAATFYRGFNVVALPYVIDAAAWRAERDWGQANDTNDSGSEDVVRFVYAGSPGAGFAKDRLDLIVQALARLTDHARAFRFEIVGITRERAEADAPALSEAHERLGERIVYRGRLPHADTLNATRAADLVVFARPNNRMSAFGFPTKIAEAYACGVPCLTNPTGDIALYLRDGETGFLAASERVLDLADALRRALETPRAGLEVMKAAVSADNPLAPDRFRPRVGAFLERVAAARRGTPLAA